MLALVLEYEQINDHDELNHERTPELVGGQEYILGKRRRRAQDQGVPLARKSALHRLELQHIGYRQAQPPTIPIDVNDARSHAQ